MQINCINYNCKNSIYFIRDYFISLIDEIILLVLLVFLFLDYYINLLKFF